MSPCPDMNAAAASFQEAGYVGDMRWTHHPSLKQIRKDSDYPISALPRVYARLHDKAWDESHILDFVSDTLKAGPDSNEAMCCGSANFFEDLPDLWRIRQFLRWQFFNHLNDDYKQRKEELVANGTDGGDPFKWLMRVQKQRDTVDAEADVAEARFQKLKTIRDGIEDFNAKDSWARQVKSVFPGNNRQGPLTVFLGRPKRVHLDEPERMDEIEEHLKTFGEGLAKKKGDLAPLTSHQEKFATMYFKAVRRMWIRAPNYPVAEQVGGSGWTAMEVSLAEECYPNKE